MLHVDSLPVVHLWSAWSPEPGPLVGLLLAAMVYLKGVRSLWRAAGAGRGISRGAAACFLGGWLLLALALCSPLDGLSEALFAGHMIQHLLLMTVAPPLLVLGRPLLAASWAFPRLSRRVSARVNLSPSGEKAWIWAIGVFVFHALTTWAWHLPALYLRALASGPVHAAEHASFLASALLLWWVALAPGAARRARVGIGLLLVAGTALQTGALGALLTLAPSVWYPGQGVMAARWGLTPLEDQQLAGLIMWVPGGLLYVVAVALLFVRWMDGRWPRHEVRIAPAALSLLLLSVGFLPACRSRTDAVAVFGGDPARGRQDLVSFGCGACHTIAGVRGAQGLVGPPLDNIGARTMIAGEVPNTPDNLINWIRNPQAIEPNTAMPDLGVTQQTATDMAAYLYTLK